MAGRRADVANVLMQIRGIFMELTILQQAFADATTPEERECIRFGIARLLDMEAACDAPTLVMSCAWCLSEQHIAPQDGESHGICARHADQVYAAYRSARCARMASVA